MLQKVSYAKSKSTIVAKLDGTFKLPTATTQHAEMTDLQHSIFNAPVPGSIPAAAPTATSGLPAKPQAAAPASTETAENRGQKRQREEDEDEDEDEDSDVAMEEDSDDD